MLSAVSSATIKNHGQKFTLRLLAKLVEKTHVTLLCHCAEDAKRGSLLAQICFRNQPNGCWRIAPSRIATT
ncbi:MAG: hypothetical protein ABIQ12_12510, partial [Opitutaceae bacterium]